MEEEASNLFDHYVAIGAVELDGVAEDGELMYKVNDIAKEIAPDLWEAHMGFVEETIIELYKKELIEIEYDEDLNANVRLSEGGIQVLRDSGYDI
jgi:hypothetical protein